MSPAHRVCFLTAALVLWLAHAGDASAEVRVGGLRVSATPTGPATTRLDPGTKVAYATFDYDGAVNHKIAVVLTARGGLAAFESARRYTGSGTDTVPIDGTAVTRNLTTDLSESALAALSDADKAANQPFGVQEYLQAVKQDLTLCDAAVYLLDSAPLGDTNAGRLASIRAAGAEATRLVDEALGLPPGQESQKRELARSLAAPLGEVSANAGQLDRSVAQMTDLPIPETGTALHATYTLQVRVTDLDYLADSIEFSVSRATVLLPWLGRSAGLGR